MRHRPLLTIFLALLAGAVGTMLLEAADPSTDQPRRCNFRNDRVDASQVIQLTEGVGRVTCGGLYAHRSRCT